MMVKVHYTQGSKLLKKYKKVAEQNNMAIKFVEMSGHSLQNLLEKANPFGSGDCGGGDKCFKCGYGGEGKSCRKRGGAYDITCEEEECKEAGVKYCGEAGRNCFSRGLEHLGGYRRQENGNVLWKHAVDKHGGRQDVMLITR